MKDKILKIITAVIVIAFLVIVVLAIRLDNTMSDLEVRVEQMNQSSIELCKRAQPFTDEDLKCEE